MIHLQQLLRIDNEDDVNNKVPYIIEINTVPGFSEESIVPKMLKSAKIKISTFISQQLEILDT